jgi:hypothetical protein
MHKRNLFVVIASLSLAASAACVGELETTGDPGDDDDVVTPPGPDAGTPANNDTEEELFNATVRPIVQRCSGEACHAGVGATPLKFLGTGPVDDFYESITSFPSVTGNYAPGLANMLMKIDAGNHYAAGYTPEERQLIVDWLTAENVTRNDGDGDGTPDPPPVGDPFAEWSGCMTIDNWNASNMGDWSDKGSDEGPCQNCHADGAWRFNTNPTNNTMFEMNRYQLYIIGFFTVKVETDGSQTIIPATDKIVRMGNGTTLHPRFNVNPDNQDFLNLEEFYNLTMQAKAAGQCAPPGFPTVL